MSKRIIQLQIEGQTRAVTPTEMSIGRSPFCTICLSNLSISRVHASICLTDGKVWLSDMGSLNGTKVNGTLVGSEPVEVCPGDEILIGTVPMQLVLVRPATEPGKITSPVPPRPKEPPSTQRKRVRKRSKG